MERLVALRPPRPDDRAAWCALVNASRPFFADWVSTRGTVPAFRAYITRSRTPAAACRLIHRRADGALVGAINLSGIVRGMFQSGCLGYYVGTSYAGQGYMTEALQLMLRTASARSGCTGSRPTSSRAIAPRLRWSSARDSAERGTRGAT